MFLVFRVPIIGSLYKCKNSTNSFGHSILHQLYFWAMTDGRDCTRTLHKPTCLNLHKRFHEFSVGARTAKKYRFWYVVHGGDGIPLIPSPCYRMLPRCSRSGIASDIGAFSFDSCHLPTIDGKNELHQFLSLARAGAFTVHSAARIKTSSRR